MRAAFTALIIALFIAAILIAVNNHAQTRPIKGCPDIINCEGK